MPSKRPLYGAALAAVNKRKELELRKASANKRQKTVQAPVPIHILDSDDEHSLSELDLEEEVEDESEEELDSELEEAADSESGTTIPPPRRATNNHPNITAPRPVPNLNTPGQSTARATLSICRNYDMPFDLSKNHSRVCRHHDGT
jgi:hypothetical protein